MKNLGFIAVMVLLMMFGCAKDDLIDTEQESMVVKENSKTIINGERNSTPYIYSFLDVISDSDGGSLIISDDLTILKKGLLSGNVKGFGPINQNPNKSYFEFTLSDSGYWIVGNYINYWYDLETKGVITLIRGGKIDFRMVTRIWKLESKDFSLVYIDEKGDGELTGGEGNFHDVTGIVDWENICVFDNNGALIGMGKTTPTLRLKIR